MEYLIICQCNSFEVFRVDKAPLIVYYTIRAIQRDDIALSLARGIEIPPNLFSYSIRVWPSGKAVDFGSTILGSNPSTRACLMDGEDFVDCIRAALSQYAGLK